MDLKEKVELFSKEGDLYHKEADVIYKKLVVLLAFIGGVGGTFLKIEIFSLFFIFLSLIFFFLIIGIYINYKRLNEIKSSILNLEEKIKGLNYG